MTERKPGLVAQPVWQKLSLLSVVNNGLLPGYPKSLAAFQYVCILFYWEDLWLLLCLLLEQIGKNSNLEESRENIPDSWQELKKTSNVNINEWDPTIDSQLFSVKVNGPH